MFPKPKTILQWVSHSECDAIVKKGQREPYTLTNLFKAPREHTYQGWGQNFEKYNRRLQGQGKELTLLRFLAFFKKENLMMISACIICYILEFTLPLLMERFLNWIDNEDSNLSEGSILLLLIVLLFFGRVVTALQNIYYSHLMTVLSKNTLEVRAFF